MTANVSETSLDGVLLIEPDVYKDTRGFFLETWKNSTYEALGIAAGFVQDNHSRSSQGVVRGLHYQLRHSQAKLITVIRGAVLDVAVDIRKGSPTFGRWTAHTLTEDNHRQLFIPEGFAHGFSVLSPVADVTYKCSDYYTPGDEYGIAHDDPDLGIDWQVDVPVVSEKDRANPLLNQVRDEFLPSFN